MVLWLASHCECCATQRPRTIDAAFSTFSSKVMAREIVARAGSIATSATASASVRVFEVMLAFIQSKRSAIVFVTLCDHAHANRCSLDPADDDDDASGPGRIGEAAQALR